MSYAPRTKLSCDSSACTVLNDDYVFVSWGLGINQRMPLADWRIIIGSEPIREEFIPLGQAPTVWSAPEPLGSPAPEPAADAPPTAAALAVAAAAAAAQPVGTKWVWSLADIPQNYRVAIQTKNGVLQVKKVSCSQPLSADYAIDLARQMFPTYAAWVNSLPTGGTVSTTLPQERLSDLEKRKKQSAKMLADGGTADAILKLQQLWKVRTQVYRVNSMNQRLKYTEDEVVRLRDQLQKLTVEDDMNWPHMRRSMTRRLAIICGTLSSLRACVARQTPEQNAERGAYVRDHYKQRLYIHTSQGKLQIAYDSTTQSVAVKVPTGANAWMYNLNFVKTLEDLPFSIGAELHLSVSYRRREIDLYA